MPPRHRAPQAGRPHLEARAARGRFDLGRHGELSGRELSVELGGELDDEARGVAALPGATLHVPGALAHERARVLVEHHGVHGRAFGRIVAVERASPDRVLSPCLHFLRCGGCDLLHASPRAAAAFKVARVRRALGAVIAQDDPRHRPLLESPRALGYRALAKWVVGEGGVLGSYAPRSHDVVDMAGCRVHAPVLERVADALRAALRAHPAPALRYVVARAATAEDRVIVTLVARHDALPDALLAALAAEPAVARAVLHLNDGAGDALFGAGPDRVLLDRAALAERLGDIEQDLDSGAFAQINPGAAEALYARVAEALAPAGRAVLDLYSGSGGIALTLARAGARSVVGIEAVPSASAAAARSAARLGLADRTRWVCGRVEVAVADAPPADAVALNPPRKGAAEAVLDALCARAPLDLAYVSCEPTTLARDLAYLAARAPLTLVSVTPVDMFPQTRHVETLVHARLGR